MSSFSTEDQEKDKWMIDCPGHFFWNSSLRRLYAALDRELNPQYFELLDYTTARYRLASWRDHSSWILDRMFKLLEQEKNSYTIRFRGVRVGATAIQLNGYFEVNEHCVQFSQFHANIERIFKEYGCSVRLGQFSIPVARFKHEFSSKHLPNLDRWEECDFGELRMSQWVVQKGSRTYGRVPLQQFIAHRGNVEGRVAADENKPEKIEALNRKGIACEIDVWYTDGKYWLGHDAPETEISFEWLMDHLPLRLIHCKHHEALDKLHRECGRLGYNVNLFYHTVEDYALTSRGHIIVHPDQLCLPDSIEMMPELSKQRDMKTCSNCVCSDSRSNLR
jgi:hypothetical protein